MGNSENISGEKVFQILDQLKIEKTILNLNIPAIGYEGLSIILDLKKNKTPPVVLMDFPGGLNADIMGSRVQDIEVEFQGPDKVPYKLRSIIKETTEDYISLPVPKTISRIQRRQFFRIPCPLGTKVIIREKHQKQYEFSVINISEGGILISHPESQHEEIQYPKGTVKSLLIVFEDGAESKKIQIDKAEIKRIETSTEMRRVNYAFQFLDHGKNEKNEIMRFIYSYQRKLLERVSIME